MFDIFVIITNPYNVRTRSIHRPSGVYKHLMMECLNNTDSFHFLLHLSKSIDKLQELVLLHLQVDSLLFRLCTNPYNELY